MLETRLDRLESLAYHGLPSEQSPVSPPDPPLTASAMPREPPAGRARLKNTAPFLHRLLVHFQTSYWLKKKPIFPL
jgi:hypothetical protein